MKKILLIGELSQVIQNINQCLVNDFMTQLCEADVDTVKKMVKLLSPDMLLLSQQGISGKEDILVLDMLKEKMPRIPVLVIETSGEGYHLEEYEDYFSKFQILKRPVVKSQLLNTCYKLLGEGKMVVEDSEQTAEKKKVMVVDDSPLVLRNIKHLLEKKYQVFIATSGKQALDFIPKKNPDIILLDYEMPEMDGKETFMKIKENPDIQNIPVLFLTGVTSKEHIYAVLELGPAGYILKPAVEEKLFEQIEEALSDESM